MLKLVLAHFAETHNPTHAADLTLLLPWASVALNV